MNENPAAKQTTDNVKNRVVFHSELASKSNSFSSNGTMRSRNKFGMTIIGQLL